MAASNGSRGTVLLVGFDEAGSKALSQVLRRHHFTVSAAPPAAALQQATATAVDAVVASYPLAIDSTQAFLSTLRRLTSASRSAAFVFVATSATRSSAEAFVGWGANRVVAVDDAPRMLPGLLDRLLRVAPRISVRGVCRLDLTNQALAHRVLCQTVNVSATGMLVRLPRVLPLGAELRFELILRPDFTPVSGRARVVRHTVDRHEPYTGVGITFSELHGDGETRLQEQLTRLSG
jgi:CheY-like chemotaxis protein